MPGVHERRRDRAQGAGHLPRLSGRAGTGRRAAHAARRRSPRAHGTERRRQVHADQGADRRVRGRCRQHRTTGTDPVAPRSPLHAQQLGISAVHQESHLLPNLSVAENICAGRYPRRPWTRGGGIDWRETQRRARELLAGLGIDLDVTQLAGGLPAALQQLAAVARAVAGDARVLILDEPTSSLDADEVQALFTLIRRLRDKGVAILFVTHFLDQVYEICDRITVLRNGRFVGEYRVRKARRPRPGGGHGGPRAGERREARGARCRGRWRARRYSAVENLAPSRAAQAHGHRVARRRNPGRCRIAGFRPNRAGATAVRARCTRLGRDRVDGQAARLEQPADAVHLGLGFCPEDRKHSGIVAELSVRENIALALQARMGLGSSST